MKLAIILRSGVLALCVLSGGCARVARLHLVERTGGSAALFGQFRAYDAHTGRPISLAEVARRCATADVVLFGEQHSDAVCNQLEAQLLCALAARKRPVALAMEFFEADTQAGLDAYLTGRIDEPAFRKQARQGREYVLAHRPLIELCRAARIPVVAANAPRRLVREYRNSGLDYETYRTGLDPADQRWLPTHSEYLSGPYRERFLAMMSEHPTGPASQPVPTTEPTTAAATQAASAPASLPAAPESQAAATAPTTSTAPASLPTTQPESAPGELLVSRPAMEERPSDQAQRMYRAQLLWDDAMAESLANFRERFPAYRVVLIVGVFHVADWGGTATKFRQRRPDDRVVTIVYSGTTDPALAFDEDDRHAGDVVIRGIVPPPEERPRTPPTTMPGPTAPAATSPGSAPSPTQPASTRD